MRAVRFAGVGHPGQITDVAKPVPGPGQVLIKIGGAVCATRYSLLGLASHQGCKRREAAGDFNVRNCTQSNGEHTLATESLNRLAVPRFR